MEKMDTDYHSFIFPVSNVTKKFLICPFLFKENPKNLRTLPQVKTSFSRKLSIMKLEPRIELQVYPKHLPKLIKAFPSMASILGVKVQKWSQNT